MYSGNEGSIPSRGSTFMEYLLRKVNLRFTRVSTVTEHGGVCIEVPPFADVDEIFKKAHEKKWKEFLTTERKYDDENWQFEIIKDSEV